MKNVEEKNESQARTLFHRGDRNSLSYHHCLLTAVAYLRVFSPSPTLGILLLSVFYCWIVSSATTFLITFSEKYLFYAICFKEKNRTCRGEEHEFWVSQVLIGLLLYQHQNCFKQVTYSQLKIIFTSQSCYKMRWSLESITFAYEQFSWSIRHYCCICRCHVKKSLSSLNVKILSLRSIQIGYRKSHKWK